MSNISDSNVTFGSAGFTDLQVKRLPLSSGFGMNRKTLVVTLDASFAFCSDEPGSTFVSSSHQVVKATGREPIVLQAISAPSPARRGYLGSTIVTDKG